MLEQLAIHVGQVERPVGRLGELDRAEPDLVGGKELAIGFRPVRGESDAARLKPHTVDQIARPLANERIAVKGCRKGVALVDRHPARRREIAGRRTAAFDRPGKHAPHAHLRPHDPPRFRRTGAVDGHPVGPDGNPRRRGGEEGIPGDVAIFVHHHVDGRAVGGLELAPPRIEGHAVLPPAALQPQLAGARVEAEVASAGLDRRGSAVLVALFPSDRAKLSTGGAGHAVDAVVQAEPQAVGQGVGIAQLEAGEDRFPHVGPAVAVGVLAVEHLGRGGDEHPAVETGHRRGPDELIREDRAAVEAAVGIDVFQQRDPSAGRAELRGVPFGVGDYLGDVHPSVFVEGHVHRVADQRLGGDQLDPEARHDVKGLQRIGRFLRRDARQAVPVVHVRIDLLDVTALTDFAGPFPRVLGGTDRGRGCDDGQQDEGSLSCNSQFAIYNCQFAILPVRVLHAAGSLVGAARPVFLWWALPALLFPQ